MGRRTLNGVMNAQLPRRMIEQGDTIWTGLRETGRHRALSHDFESNKVPGIQPYEERGYWRDIGTLDAYKAAQRDVLGPLPRFSLENPEWPIRGGGCRVRTAKPNNARAGESNPGKGKDTRTLQRITGGVPALIEHPSPSVS